MNFYCKGDCEIILAERGENDRVIINMIQTEIVRGNVLEIHHLSVNGNAFGIDTQPGVIHTFLALEPDTIVFEVKQGPYDAKCDKQFMSWAPEENTQEAQRYLEFLESL